MANKFWLDPEEYPFKSNYFNTGIGKMHYVDEGKGPVILFFHGNPAWSFTYRKLIKKLSSKYRCIAIDYIGFGLSDKPYNWSYLPKEHAKYTEAFISWLGLRDVTLVVNDWGGPIGLSYAIKHPENVKALVLFNTWLWSVKGNKYYEQFSGMMGGIIGRFLIKYFNFFGKSVVAKATGNKNNFPKQIRKVYYQHLKTPKDRKGCYVFPKEIINSSEWLAELWAKKDKIQQKPALLLWGMKDIAFRKDILEKWKSFFTNVKVTEFTDAGHYPQEEKGEIVADLISSFLEAVK